MSESVQVFEIEGLGPQTSTNFIFSKGLTYYGTKQYMPLFVPLSSPDGALSFTSSSVLGVVSL